MMKLRVLVPTGVLADEPATKVVAEAEDGWFCLEPRHVDFVAALVPGILAFRAADGEERNLAIAEGLLVKEGPRVTVSVRDAARGPDLGALRRIVVEHYEHADERERAARAAVARLELDFVQRFLQLGEDARG